MRSAIIVFLVQAVRKIIMWYIPVRVLLGAFGFWIVRYLYVLDNLQYLIKEALSNHVKFLSLSFSVITWLVRVSHDKLVAEFRFKVKWSFVLNNWRWRWHVQIGMIKFEMNLFYRRKKKWFCSLAENDERNSMIWFLF